MEFVSFNLDLTIPYPSVEFMLCWWIIGSLTTVYYMCRSCVTDSYFIRIKREVPTKFYFLVVLTATMIWPYMIWIDSKVGLFK